MMNTAKEAASKLIAGARQDGQVNPPFAQTGSVWKGENNDELRNLLRGSLFELIDGAFIAMESKTIIKSGGDEETLYRMLLKSVGGAAKQETHQYMTEKVKRYNRFILYLDTNLESSGTPAPMKLGHANHANCT